MILNGYDSLMMFLELVTEFLGDELPELWKSLKFLNIMKLLWNKHYYNKKNTSQL